MTILSRLSPLLIVLALLILAMLGLFGGDREKALQSPMVGQKIAFFDLPTLTSYHTRFNPDLWLGRVAVINIFASWCEPCAVEQPALMKLAATGKVAIYGVAWKDKEDNVVQWLAKRGNPYQTVGLDQAGKSTIAFGLSGVPETYVIAPDGTVTYNYHAPLTDEVVTRDILPLVERLRTSHVVPQ